MRKRPLGATALEVSELCLGTWGLSGDAYGTVVEVEQERVIERALGMGIRVFDTADSYAEGAMERRLGKLLPRDGSTLVITKVGTRLDAAPARKDFSARYLRDAIERSRERLARETLDCVLLHNPSRQAFELNDLGPLFAELVEKGTLKTWGASVGTAEIGRAALGAGARVLELAYNLFHSQDLLELEPEIRAQQPGIVVRSVLAHGLLCGLWPPGKEFASFDHRSERWTNDELRRRILQLNPVRTLLSPNSPSLRSIALRFALSHEHVSTVVLGPRSTLQLDQLVREAGKEPPYIEDTRLSELRQRLLNVGVHI